MKIKYNITENFYKYLDVALDIFINKKILQKNPNKKIKSYTKKGLDYLLITFLIFITGIFIYSINNSEIFLKVFSNIIGLIVALILGYYIVFFLLYLPNKKKIHSGILTINKEGITDVSDDDLTIKIGWDKVELIVVMKYELVIVTKCSWFIFADIENQDDVIKGIKKYNQDVILIKNNS